jgi:ABC-type multidrug transport system ATPase subunit
VTTGKAVIETSNLAKRFGDVQAVAGVDADVCDGELFGFLGPNGAGKTTTINMLTGLARPDAGTVRIAGIDCSRKRYSSGALLACSCRVRTTCEARHTGARRRC